MDLSDFKLLMTIADEGSISSAGRVLRISPSLATRRLAALERELGLRLVNRTTRRLDLTEAGRLLCASARDILGRYDSTLDALQSLNREPTGQVRLVCPEVLAVRVLPAMLRSFARRYPKISLAVTTVDDVTQVDEDRFDVAIHVGSPPRSELVVKHVLDVEMLLCAAPDYVAECGTPDSPQDLARHRCLDHASFNPGIWCFQRSGRAIQRIQVEPYLRATNTIVLHEAALQGVGIARLTRRVARQDLMEGRLVQALPGYTCVQDNGRPLALWTILPHRQLLQRTRLFVEALVDAVKDAEPE